MFKRLLAKSIPHNAQKYSKAWKSAGYTAHIGAVMQSADILLDKIGATIIEQLDLDVEFSYFANTVKLGAYLHDWGKANQHFQEMLYLKSLPKSDDPKIKEYRKRLQAEQKSHERTQMLRHEVISGILALQVPSFRAWLEKYPNANLMVAVWAAMGHHLKLHSDFTDICDGTGSKLRIFTQHDDFTLVLKMGRQYLGLPTTLPELCKEEWTKSELKAALQALSQEFQDFEKSLTPKVQKFIAAVKATVMAADLAGSALPTTEYDLKDWVAQVLSLILSEDEIQKLLDKRLKKQPLREFQRQIAETKSRVTIVKAGCGTGKTAGAYAWAKKWGIERKLFFCYPTTGTASQGYLDYAAENEFETELMHSRAAIDLEEVLFSNDLEKKQDDDNEARLAAFAAWQAKLVVCTVDTVLGLIQNNRKPLYSFPAIAQGAFVFDEVHSYDNRLFAELLIFLKTFKGAPTLLMSASFSPTQLELIQNAVEAGGETVEMIEGYRKLEELPRYRLCYFPEATENSPEVWQEVLKALSAGQKVLWVTNSVQTCINIYRQAETEIAANLPEQSIQRLIYHSRFRYRDRVNKHKQVIEAFKSSNAVFAVTTQVCEMSLDLSADLLISSLAPAAALVQRLGRLNRFVVEDKNGNISLKSGRISTAIIYAWKKDDLPYTKTELDTGKKLIAQLESRSEISQQQLAGVSAKLDTTSPEQIRGMWLEGNWCTYPEPARKEGYTVTVLLEQDIAEIKKKAMLRLDKSFMKEAQGWSVSIRIPDNFYNWKRIKFYRVAPTDEVYYSPETGAEQ
ncbi:CRISPR-associated helicase Cas3' [Lusitaniella coriacea]|uniref:CRISPR-associated helicase Cas3' n=1 Tax=Lusitaniella coriacea TaxID=1983105 RepID=UPI003CF56CD5